MKEKEKRFRWILWTIIVILIPIIYHQVNGFVGAKIQQASRMRPATVQTINPKTNEIYSESESTGRIEAKYSVDVLARINGWLQKRYFSEGAKIKKGQTLFLIEPNEYQIAVSNAQAAVRRSEAALINSEKELQRAQELVKKDYVSKSYYDDALSLRDQNKAALDSAKAQLANAKLNLSYTKVTSPIDGKIGKIMITEGNLVNTQSGPLAKIVSVRPIYVYFNLKSSEFIKFKKANKTVDLSNMNVNIQLADGSVYKENGKIEFVDNTVNETTGTISLRATFQNADELLVPGDFVKVMVKSKNSQDVLLIPQTATMDDSEGYYVWVVKEVPNDNTNAQQKKTGILDKIVDKYVVKKVIPENTSETKWIAERRNISVSDEINKNWVVIDGLTKDDVVVGKGIQGLYTGRVVNPSPLEESVSSEK